MLRDSQGHRLSTTSTVPGIVLDESGFPVPARVRRRREGAEGKAGRVGGES